MLISIRGVRRWVNDELAKLKDTVFEIPPKDIIEFERMRGRFMALSELKEQLRDGEEEPER